MKKITRFHAKKILDWCKKKYGRGTCKYPTISYRKSNYLDTEDVFGEYDFEEFSIYVNNEKHSNLYDLANTIIHEYVHYRYHKKSMYYKLDEKYGHENNPFEKQAISVADRDEKKCVQELKKYYKQFNL